MLALTNSDAVARALNNLDLDLDLRALIGLRAWQIHVRHNRPFGDVAKFIVVEGGDTPEVINDALGFAITGEHAEEPSYEWIKNHGLWFELAYARGDGRCTLIYVENTPATELGLHHLCLAHFWSDGQGGGQ